MSLEIIYSIKYSIPALFQRTESAVIIAARDIYNEATSTPDHAHRLKWAQYTNVNSSVSTIYFMWSLAMNSTIQAAVEADPSGETVTDNDIQFVVSSSLPQVLDDFKANPPPGFNSTP